MRSNSYVTVGCTYLIWCEWWIKIVAAVGTGEGGDRVKVVFWQGKREGEGAEELAGKRETRSPICQGGVFEFW
jgi:hypothetical protein